jgi:hypothetical protein
MEALAYLHCASAYDESPLIELMPDEENQSLCDGLDWKKFSSQVCLALMPFAIVVAALGSPQPAQASHRCGEYTSCKVYRRVIHKPKYYVKHYPVVIRRPVYHYSYYPVYRHYPVVIRRPKFVHVTYPVVIPRPRYYYKDFPVAAYRPKCHFKRYKVVHRPSCHSEWDGGGYDDGFDSVVYRHRPQPVLDYDNDDGFAVYNRSCESGSCSG